jgi:hypothetical protein
MKFLRRVLLVLLLIVLVAQIPFVYRRYQLGRLNAKIQELNAGRTVIDGGEFVDYKGVLHVHSFLGGHSAGTFDEIIKAAKSNGLQFVIMTEHPEPDFGTSEMTLKGPHAGILFINGNEVRTRESDRLLIAPGDVALDNAGTMAISEVLSQTNARGALSVVAYPDEFKSWDNGAFDAIEVYNVYSNARQMSPFVAFFDSVWSYRSYHDLLFATFYRRPDPALSKWDEITAQRKIVGLAGNDAHANIGISLNDYSGKTLLGLRLDPYETSFRLVRIHVLIPRGKALDFDSLLSALKAGHCFIGFDLFGDSSGFSLTAASGGNPKIQGDEIVMAREVRFSVRLPVAGRIVLLRNGTKIEEANGVAQKEFSQVEKGTYRVEVYLPQLGHPVGDQPWIISNPIYVR